MHCLHYQCDTNSAVRVSHYTVDMPGCGGRFVAAKGSNQSFTRLWLKRTTKGLGLGDGFDNAGSLDIIITTMNHMM
jgi:hypothetical protein